jgi:protein-S-isoprenylcysteine O-methyltransferase Ste14
MAYSVKELLYSPLANRLAGLILGACWLLFAWVNLRAFIGTGNYAFLLFFLTETLQALYFVIRKEPKTVSTDVFAWAAAFGGTFAVLSLRPGGPVIWQGGSILILIGFTLQIVALVSLNTSFAIAPANRGIKTKLGYRLVRHPIYATYLISTYGYFLFNASLSNAYLLSLFTALTLLRIREEEKHLMHDEKYREYTKRVKFRLVPFLY